MLLGQTPVELPGGLRERHLVELRPVDEVDAPHRLVRLLEDEHRRDRLGRLAEGLAPRARHAGLEVGGDHGAVEHERGHLVRAAGRHHHELDPVFFSSSSRLRMKPPLKERIEYSASTESVMPSAVRVLRVR